MKAAAALLALASLACASTDRAKGLAPIAGATTGAVASAFAPRRVALVVGVDAPGDPAWPALRYPRSDAAEVARVLRDRQLGAFDEVVNLDAAQATREGLLTAVDALAGRAPSADDTVVLYVSGHGALADTRDGPRRMLVMTGTQRDRLLATGLAVDELVRRFDALPSRRKVLVLATCHSGSEKVAGPVRLKGAALENVSRASIVLSAAGFGQAAREDDRLGGDVYTHFLVEALVSAADANGDGAVTASEAHAWARQRTYEFTGGAQVAVFEATIAGTDPVVLAGRLQRPGLPVLFGYAPTLDGVELSVAGRSKGVFPGDVVLEAGAQEVTLTRPGDAGDVRATVTLAPGDRLDAAALWARRDPAWRVSASWNAFGLLSGGLSGTTFAPVSGPGLALEKLAIGGSGLALRLDGSGLGGAHAIAPQGFALTSDARAIQLGAAVVEGITLGPLRLTAGPRLAFVHLERSVATSAGAVRQAFGSLLPGAHAGVAGSWGRGSLMITGDLQWLPLVLDGENRSVLAGGAGVAAGWSF